MPGYFGLYGYLPMPGYIHQARFAWAVLHQKGSKLVLCDTVGHNAACNSAWAPGCCGAM